MAQAELGDDVYGEDPSVNRLQEYAAKLMGKEAALLVPTGTMGNLAAVLAHCPKRGTEAGQIAHEAHFYESIESAHNTCTVALPEGCNTAPQQTRTA